MAAADKDLQAAIAVTRFGLGARPGELDAVRPDPRGWLKDQIRRDGADEPQGPNGPLPSMRDSFGIFADYQAAIRPVRQAAKAAQATPASLTQAGGMTANAMADAAMAGPAMNAPATAAPNANTDIMAMRRAAAEPIRQDVGLEMLSRTQLGATTSAGFRERWALFWANHFTMADKGLNTSVAVGPFEREAVRPHVFGRFQDMLAATSRHPGMLMYLDQAQSAGPDSPVGKQRRNGLNENLAREILELHTLGADGGYTQADVTEFARALTGWSMGGAAAGQQQGEFIYRIGMHEPGPRQVLGRNYAAGDDSQAAEILAALAAHPATARHLARKLAVHFVADQPDPALVARLETSWTRSGGDLAAVAQALIDAPQAWAPAAVKLKTPNDFVVSAYRAAGATPAAAPDIVQPLTVLGQRPFSAPQPNGWSDQAADWAAPDALVKRLTWARRFAARYAPQGAPSDVAVAALGARLSPAAAAAVARSESRPEAFALLLMSPEFQRR